MEHIKPETEQIVKIDKIYQAEDKEGNKLPIITIKAVVITKDGEAVPFYTGYSLRGWLDPEKFAEIYNVDPKKWKLADYVSNAMKIEELFLDAKSKYKELVKAVKSSSSSAEQLVEEHTEKVLNLPIKFIDIANLIRITYQLATAANPDNTNEIDQDFIKLGTLPDSYSIELFKDSNNQPVYKNGTVANPTKYKNTKAEMFPLFKIEANIDTFIKVIAKFFEMHIHDKPVKMLLGGEYRYSDGELQLTLPPANAYAIKREDYNKPIELKYSKVLVDDRNKNRQDARKQEAITIDEDDLPF